jgi:hypothetical protein
MVMRLLGPDLDPAALSHYPAGLPVNLSSLRGLQGGAQMTVLRQSSAHPGRGTQTTTTFSQWLPLRA